MDINQEVIARLVTLAGRSNRLDPERVMRCGTPHFSAEALILIARAEHSMPFSYETMRVLKNRWSELRPEVKDFALELFRIEVHQDEVIINIR